MNKNTVLILIVVVCLIGAGVVIAMNLKKAGPKDGTPAQIGPATAQPAPAN
jgi:hypothetical protein